MIRALHHWPVIDVSRRIALEATFVILVATLIVTAGHLFPATFSHARVRLSVHASIVSTLVLAASALCYVAHALLRAPMLGRSATASAALGASGLLGASIARWWEVQWLAPGALQFSAQYELLTWVAAFCVYVYLAAEDVYATRSAGAFLIACVLVALTVAAWLIGMAPLPDPTFTVVTVTYVQDLIVVSTIVGYGAALAVAAHTAWRIIDRRRRGPRAGTSDPMYAFTAVGALCAAAAHVALVAAARFVPDAAERPRVDPWLASTALVLAVACFAWRWRGARPDALVEYVGPGLIVAGLIAWLAS